MTRTAADICRERGWGEGTLVTHDGAGAMPYRITAVGAQRVLGVGAHLGPDEWDLGITDQWREHDPDADLVDEIVQKMRRTRMMAVFSEDDVSAIFSLLRGRGECFADHQGDGILSALIAGLDDFFVHGEDLILRYDGSPAAFAALERFESAYDRETEQP